MLSPESTSAVPTEGRPATGCPPPHIVSYAQKIVSTGRPGVVAAPSELDTSYRGLFRVPGLSTLITATLAGRIATQMSSVLIVLYVLETSHSPQLSGLVILCSQFPGILVSPIAGALLDRCPKIPLMVIDYLVGSAAVFAIGALRSPTPCPRRCCWRSSRSPRSPSRSAASADGRSSR